MEREIKVAGATFTVDDPKGSMERIETLDLKAEQAGLETARTRDEEAAPFSARPKPNPSDPFQYIEARVNLFDAVAHGRVGPWSMVAAWLTSAIGAYSLAWEMIYFSHAAIGIALGLLILLAHTAFFVRATTLMQARRGRK